MARMAIGNLPADTRLPECAYCGHVSDGTALRNGYAHEVCADCDARNIVSDAFKDAWGFRPRFLPLSTIRAIYRGEQGIPQ